MKSKLKNEHINFLPSRSARILSFFSQNRTKSAYLLLIGITITALSVSLVMSWNNSKKQSATTQLGILDTSGKLPGWWFQEYFGESVCNTERCLPESDPDSDSLNNEQEFYYKTSPVEADSNKNGKNDGEDVALGFDPSQAGDVTFEQAESDEYILGESILYGDDIKNILNEIADPTKLPLPEVSESTLKISEDNSVESLTRYMTSNSAIIKEYFDGDEEALLKSAIETNNSRVIGELKNNAAKITSDLKLLTVPREALKFHVYTIMMFELYPIVIDPPGADVLADEYNAAGNIWYQKTQTYAVVLQKLDSETTRLQNKYQ